MDSKTFYNEPLLLRQVAAGDSSAFRSLYDHYKDSIYSFALGISRSVLQAEDIVQESFIRVWLHRDELPEIKKFENWLFTIARNLCYSALRRMALEEKVRNLQHNKAVNDHSSPEDILITRENQALVQEAIHQLPPQQKLVYILSREEGLNQDEIAKKLHISRHTVKEHMSRANAGIKAFLQSKLALITLAVIQFCQRS